MSQSSCFVLLFQQFLVSTLAWPPSPPPPHWLVSHRFKLLIHTCQSSNQLRQIPLALLLFFISLSVIFCLSIFGSVGRSCDFWSWSYFLLFIHMYGCCTCQILVFVIVSQLLFFEIVSDKFPVSRIRIRRSIILNADPDPGGQYSWICGFGSDLDIFMAVNRMLPMGRTA
jgi:hypothetical protein